MFDRPEAMANALMGRGAMMPNAQKNPQTAFGRRRQAKPVMGPRSRLAQQGRYGDNMLAHVNPREAALLQAMGGAGSVNPRTGLREFYDTGSADAPGGSDFGGSDGMGADDAGSDSGGSDGVSSFGEGDFGGFSFGEPTGLGLDAGSLEGSTTDVGIEGYSGGSLSGGYSETGEATGTTDVGTEGYSGGSLSEPTGVPGLDLSGLEGFGLESSDLEGLAESEPTIFGVPISTLAMQSLIGFAPQPIGAVSLAGRLGRELAEALGLDITEAGQPGYAAGQGFDMAGGPGGPEWRELSDRVAGRTVDDRVQPLVNAMFARPEVETPPEMLMLGPGLSDLQRRTLIATRGTMGNTGLYRSPEAKRHYAKTVGRQFISPEGSASSGSVTPIERLYLQSAFGTNKEPADIQGILKALQPYFA